MFLAYKDLFMLRDDEVDMYAVLSVVWILNKVIVTCIIAHVTMTTV